MNIGRMTSENEEFIEHYKDFGYATKTQLFNDAIEKLRQAKAKENRRKKIQLAFRQLANAQPDVAFESIEGEEFIES